MEDAVQVEMSLVPIGSKNRTYIQYGKTVKFTCTVNLRTPYQTAEEFDGISLRVNNSQGDVYEDGCLTQTMVGSDKRFFVHQTERCDPYRNTATSYSAEITFTVPTQLIGWNMYQCLFRAKSVGFIFNSNIISGQSKLVTILGTSPPKVDVSPLHVEGFQGERRVISCTSTGGFPLGTVILQIGNISLESSKLILNRQVQSVETELLLTKDLHQKIINCTNSRHEDSYEESAKLFVKYAVPKNATKRIELPGVNKNIKLDCSKTVESNVELNYSWQGLLVAYTQVNKPIVDISYSTGRQGGTFRVLCMVKMNKDPSDQSITIEYVLTFVAAKTPAGKDKSSNNTIAIISVIIAILIVTAIIIGVAVGREVTSRKINSKHPNAAQKHKHKHNKETAEMTKSKKKPKNSVVQKHKQKSKKTESLIDKESKKAKNMPSKRAKNKVAPKQADAVTVNSSRQYEPVKATSTMYSQLEHPLPLFQPVTGNRGSTIAESVPMESKHEQVTVL